MVRSTRKTSIAGVTACLVAGAVLGWTAPSAFAEDMVSTPCDAASETAAAGSEAADAQATATDDRAADCSASLTIATYDRAGSETLALPLTGGGKYSGAEDSATEADSADDAADLTATGGQVDRSITVVNDGSEPLIEVVVTDHVAVGEAQIEAMTCLFPGERLTTEGTRDEHGDWTVTWQASASGAEDRQQLEPGAGFDCRARLVGVEGTHLDHAEVSGVAATSREPVTARDDYNAIRRTAQIAIETYDPDGSETIDIPRAGGTVVPIVDVTDADTPDQAALVPGATSRPIAFTVVNTGTEDLVDVVVTDTVVAGEGMLYNAQCLFPGAEAPVQGVRNDSGSWLLSWSASASDAADPVTFAVGSTFECTAELVGVSMWSPHANAATATGMGVDSGIRVADRDDFNARRIAPGTEASQVAAR